MKDAYQIFASKCLSSTCDKSYLFIEALFTSKKCSRWIAFSMTARMCSSRPFPPASSSHRINTKGLRPGCVAHLGPWRCCWRSAEMIQAQIATLLVRPEPATALSRIPTDFDRARNGRTVVTPRVVHRDKQHRGGQAAGRSGGQPWARERTEPTSLLQK